MDELGRDEYFSLLFWLQSAYCTEINKWGIYSVGNVVLSKQVTHDSPRLGLTTTLINKPPPLSHTRGSAEPWCIYYWNLQFINNVIIIKANVRLPQR